MSPEIKRVLDRGRSILSDFTAGQKAMTAIAIVALVVGGYVFSSWASQADFTPLFSNLAASDASAMTDKLTAMKEPFKLTAGGTSILVPQKDVYQLRLDMAKANLPNGGQSGFALLDKGGVTTSQFQQNIQYQQAIEGELVKTIESIDGVQSAVVNVVMPPNDVFSSDAAKSTASVLVTVDPGKPLAAGQVQAIVHLVSSSVQGLTPDQVTVADSMGHVLSAPGVDGSADSSASLQDQQTYAYEQRVSAAVQTLLQPVVGVGHVIVQVSANLNFDAHDTTSEAYVQPSAGATAVPLSQTKSVEIYSGAGQVSAGILGPDNIAMPPVSATASPGSYASQSSTTDNAIGRVVQQVKTAPGAVERLSVAVLLDSNVAGKIDAAAVQRLVTNAAGVQTARGDSVQVSSMAFDQTAARATQKALTAAADKKSMSTLIGYAKDAVLVVIVLGVIFFLMHRAKRAAERSPVLSISERLELDEAQRMLAISAPQSELARVPALIGGPRGQDGVEARRPAFDSEIGDLVERQPEEVAQLLRGWLADRRGA